MRCLAACLGFLTLAACGGPDELVLSPQVVVTERIPTRFRSIEVVEVSLPTYAAGEQVAVSDDGALILSDVLWADDPTRSVTLALTRNLQEVTGRRVAPEPWPFDEGADVRVDVRVEELFVSKGILRMSGQYFVADQTGAGRDHAHIFAFSAPIGTFSAQATATGRARLVAELAREIAEDGL